MFKKTGLLFLICLFLFLRIFNLEKGVNFSADQGLILERVWQIYKTGKTTLIGPETSIKAKNGRAFYTGPATYYLLIPPMVLFRGDTIAVSYYLIFLNLIALLIIYYIVQKRMGTKTAFWAGLFFATFPNLVTYSRFVWNPNFLPLFVSILLFLLWEAKPFRTFFYFILLGFTLGACLQFHYQAVLLIILSFTWLIIKKIPFFKFIPILVGFVIGFFPLIIFELRHDFYNLRTLWLILQTGTDKTLSFLPFYYILALIPFFSVLIGIFTNKIISLNKFIGLSLVFLYLIWSISKILSFPLQPPGMPPGWNYLGQQKVLQIILSENKKNYNIASLLSGDTREMAIRYLLMINGQLPMAVETYPEADWLFVLSRYNKEKTKSDPVWEIKSFIPSEIVQEWSIQNNVKLYLFEKIKS